MNPISSDIFGRLAWLTKWVKNLLGRVYILEQSGAGSYKVYTALLTQSGTDAPTAIVLENTIGNISFTYQSAGVYYLNCSNVFLEDKYFAPMPISYYDEGVNQSGGGSGYNWVRFNNSIVIISSLGGDNQLINTPIEIRVYS